MGKKTVSNTVFGITTIAAAVAGYFLGKKFSDKPSIPQLSGKINAKSVTNERPDLIINLQTARSYHKDFETFRAEFEKNPECKEFTDLFKYPINLDRAIDDLKEMFKQDEIAGLRMYTGLRWEGKTKIFTPLIIGTRADGSDLIYKSEFKEESAKVHDNSRPCNPCANATF